MDPMSTQLQFLTPELVDRILDEAFQLLLEPGVQVQSPKAQALLASAGAQVDQASGVTRIPEAVVRQALATVPKEFDLYNQAGAPAVQIQRRRPPWAWI